MKNVKTKECIDKDVKQSAAICYSMFDQDKKESFGEILDRVYNEETSKCDVCAKTTIAFQETAKETIKERIRKLPLNEKHSGTYRQRYEFIVKDNVWKATMKNDNKYICLECWERDFLTPLLKTKGTKRAPNKFGFFHVVPEDLTLGNPVNNNVADFFNAVNEEKRTEQQQKEYEKYKKIIGKHDMQHGFDD
jgi:hypothetical protein